MIQISPPIAETADPSAAEMIHKPKTEKKDGLGIFAKILAGLLRKAGEKDAPAVSGGDIGVLNVKDPESGEPEELSALFPDMAGQTKGKKPGKTGTPDPENPGGIRTPDAKNRKPARNIADREGDWNVVSINPLPLNRAETAGAGASGKAGPAKGPEGMGPPVPGDGENPVEPGLEFVPGRTGLNAGLPAGTGPEGEPIDGKGRVYRRGKFGDNTKSSGSPEEREASGPGRDTGGLQLSDMKKGGVPENGKEGGRLAESRSRDKRRDRVNLEVRDLRTGDGEQSTSPSGAPAAQNTAVEARSIRENGETDITLELRGDNPGREAPDAAGNSWETRSAQSFEHILARELHENLNGDIVRHASMVLRDNGQGTIRLSLKPESLGNVKIRLEMAENKITGHIVVESEEALRAFEREVHSLEQAFRDSGFDGAELDMSLAQGGGGAEQRWNGEETDRPFLSERLAASRYDAAAEHTENPGLFAPDARNGMYTRHGRIAVNMLI